MKRMITILALAGTMVLAAAPTAFAGDPTCSDVFGEDDPIANHGQHVVGDYVTGIGHEALGWPPEGQVGGGGGVALAGGPGPGFHFTIEGLAPGASFCTDRAAFTTPGPFTP
ncbi:MAG: hypothetical protein IH941_00970 [Acidobacteria bacterium]|nr:hypothetical protein [Acidobacteriota bacterium]